MTTLSATDLAHPIVTFNQLGGRGRITNKALAIPVHLGGPWNSLEYVQLDPAGADPTEVGEHVQPTDEIYWIVKGTGVLTTNGREETVRPGFLAIAPRGTRHRLRNLSTKSALGMLVVELKAPDPDRSATSIPNLFEQLTMGSSWHPANMPLLMAGTDLSTYFSAPWGTLYILQLPEGAEVYEYALEGADELLFVLEGEATIIAGGRTFFTEDNGLSVLVPAGISRQIIDRTPSDRLPCTLLSLEVRREAITGDGRGQHSHGEARA